MKFIKLFILAILSAGCANHNNQDHVKKSTLNALNTAQSLGFIEFSCEEVNSKIISRFYNIFTVGAVGCNKHAIYTLHCEPNGCMRKVIINE